MNIGLVTCWYNSISMANYSYNLKAALQKHPFLRVKVVSSTCSCEYDRFIGVSDKLINRNCSFVQFPPFVNVRPKSKVSWILYDVTQIFLHFLRGLSYLSRCKDCDVIHYEQSDFSFGVLPLIPFMIVPTANKKVVTAHTLDRTVGLKILVAMYNRANRVIVHSDEMRRTLISLGVNASKIEVIPHGVKIPSLLSEERNEITFFGAPVKAKGVFVLLEALKLLKEKGDKTVVNFYGIYSSSEKEAVDARGNELGVGDCITWGGRLNEEDFDRKMQKSLFTFAVYSAPVSGSSILTRAMGNAVPVIAANTGGLPEYTENLVLIPPDDADALANAISKLKRDPDLRRRLSKAVREDAMRISWDAVAEKTFKVYLNALRR